MTDVALLVNSTDTALLNGSGAAPVSAAEPVTGGFAGVLGKQLAASDSPVAMESPPPLAENDSIPVAQPGEPAPPTGKALPSVAQQEAMPNLDMDAPVLDSALLSAIAQETPAVVEAMNSNTHASMPIPLIDPVVGESGMRSQPLLATLGKPHLPPETAVENKPEGPAVLSSSALSAMANLPAVTAAEQKAASTLAGTAQEAQRAASNPATLAMLGKPISTLAQQALVRASLNESKPSSLRQDGLPASYSITGSTEQGLPGVLARANHSMGNGLRMDAFAAAMSHAIQKESKAEIRLPTNVASISSPSALTATSVLPDGSINLLADTPRTSLNGYLPSLAVSTPVGQPGWAGDMGQRVTWLANSELREAQLQLHPRSLGAVEVRIAYGAEHQLHVNFSAANPIAREALEAALPRLREMFEQQGLNLADANISHESPAEGEQRNNMGEETHSQNFPHSNHEEMLESAGANQSPAHWISEGMLDAYA